MYHIHAQLLPLFLKLKYSGFYYPHIIYKYEKNYSMACSFFRFLVLCHETLQIYQIIQ